MTFRVTEGRSRAAWEGAGLEKGCIRKSLREGDVLVLLPATGFCECVHTPGVFDLTLCVTYFMLTTVQSYVRARLHSSPSPPKMVGSVEFWVDGEAQLSFIMSFGLLLHGDALTQEV